MNITPDPSPPIELPLELVWRVWEESADNLPHLATLAQFMGSVHRERIEQVMYHTIVIRTQVSAELIVSGQVEPIELTYIGLSACAVGLDEGVPQRKPGQDQQVDRAPCCR